MNSTTAVSRAIRHALMLGAALSATTISAQAFAQSSEQTNGVKEIERISVTGSRINRTDMETASPVTVISSEFISQSGFNSVEEILSTQPGAAGMSLGASSNNGSGGTATVNLRGMNEERTLVLLNGRRMVASGTGADSSVDLNTIPVSMIQSIEILKDGASAVYGSDAIAGVVNIITKKDFVGTELSADASITQELDGESGGFSLLHGTEALGGNLVVGAQYSQRGEIIQSDRDFVPPGTSSYIPEGTLGGQAPDGNGGFKPQDSTYDYTTSSYAQTPNELMSLFASFDKELDVDTSLNIDAMYTRRESNQQLAPQPAAIDLLTGNLDDEYQILANGEETVLYKRRMVDAGPRIYDQVTDTYRTSAELIGQLDNDDQWNVSVTYARNKSTDRVKNSIHGDNMQQSVYSNQALWFNGDSLSHDFLTEEGVMYTEVNEGGNEQFVLAAGYSGLSDNDIGYAFGIESRQESGFYTPDMVVQNGESTASQQAPTDGSYSVQSIYGEVAVPVNDDFSIEAATRYDNYSTFGGALTWKLGATYRLTDGFMVRAVAATGFRAPNVSELYGGDTASFDYLTDPWGNAEDAQIETLYTSDDNLKAEESDSLTLGVVWEITDGLSTTLDYWSFDVTNAISRSDTQDEMNKCFKGDMVACDLINITPSGDLSNITSELTNIGQLETSGYDWNIQYTHDIVTVSLDTTFLKEFKKDDKSYDGWIDGNQGGYSKIKSYLSVNVNLTEDISALYNMEYIRGMQGEMSIGKDEILRYKTDNIFYHNLSATYHLNDNWKVAGGIKNLLNTEPEEVPNGNDMNTVPNIYDVIGRTYFVNTTYKF